MKKINIDNWKEFRVGDLFDVIRGKSRRMQTLEDGDIPIIAAAKYNRGVAGYYNVPKEYENEITISCNGGCGSTYFHDYSFAITGDAVVLKSKELLSNLAKQYIASIYNSYFPIKYSYNDKCSPDKIIEEVIKLPATPDGKPDWQYMEEYMEKAIVETQKKIDQFKRVNCEKKSVDIGEWKEFRVGDLLENENKCVYGKDKKWVENEKPDSNSIPVVSGTTFNNGVTYYTNEKPSEDEVFENCLTITTRGEYSGTMFYHEGKFVLANNILVLPFKCKNIYQSLFIKIVIDRLGYGGYDNYPTRNKIIEDIIKLPVTPDGEPDWQYMEDYVKKSINKAKKNLNSFKKAEF